MVPTVLPKKEIENNTKTKKYFIITYLISMIIIFTIAIVTSSILGKYLLQAYQYPVYITLKRISLFNFIDRIENFLSFQWILSGITVIAMTIYSVSKNIKNKESKLINFIITILMIILSYLLFKNNTSFNEYLYTIYPYLLLPIPIIYVIIFIGAVIKKKYK
jgi:spore germination protein KB